jgi:lipopolysaccharide transport system ATP-binding protein
MQSLLLEANNLGKSYPADSHAVNRLRAMLKILLGCSQSLSNNSVAVLRDVNLRVHAGQSIGIIGENGAGKSTLLKLLSGVIKPTTGRLQCFGSIAALIELSAGFDMEASGIENIYLKTALMGLSRKQTRAHLDAIIEFADIDDALSQPVKTYSSGMVVRLGFAIVAIQKPQLLMTDEVLAVGDESFQRKCINWLDNYLADGGTLLMVSHSTYQIKRLCQQTIWIHEHQVAMQGDSDKVIAAYLDWHAEKQSKTEQTVIRAINPHSYQVLSMRLLNAADAEVEQVESGGCLRIEITLSSPDGRKPAAGFGLIERGGLPVYGVASTEAPASGSQIDAHQWRFLVDIPQLQLLAANYIVRVHALDPEGIRVCDSMEMKLAVRGSSLELGNCRIAHQWR